MAKLHDTKPPIFTADLNWRVWKVKFRGWLRENELLDVVVAAEVAVATAIGATGYDAVLKALAPKAGDNQEKKETIGYYLLKALGDKNSNAIKLIDEVTTRDPALIEDGAILWCCLLVLMEAKTVVTKDRLLEELTSARCRPGESVYEFATRVRRTGLELAQADPQMKQSDAMLVQFILKGLPDHFELWKESFRGRAEDQRSLARLIADLEKEANEEEAGTGQQTKVAAMFKAAASNEKIMAMFQASKTARPTNDDLIMCDRCGGRHHNRKCQFRGTCFDCGRRGHKAEYCRTPSQESGFTRSKDKPGDKKTRFQGCKLNTRLTGLVELKRKFDAGQTPQSTATMTTPDVTDWFLIQNKNVWGLDSCSEEHSTPHLDLLTDVQDVGDHAPEFQFGNSTTEIPKKMGRAVMTIASSAGEKRELELFPVYLVPSSPCNLISTGALKEKGHGFYQPAGENPYVLFAGHFRVSALETGRVPLLVAHGIIGKATLVSRTTWHRRLGHIGDPHLDQLTKFVDGLDIDETEPTLRPCDACPAGKSKRPPFPKKARERTTAPNQLVHTDLGGKMPPDINGFQYPHIMVDDYTREGMLNLLRFKSDAPKTLEKWNKRFDSMGKVRADNARELTKGRWGRICDERKIDQETTCPHTPQQNGIAERRLAVLEADAKAMCAQAKLPYQDFWGYAQLTACLVRNLTISKAASVNCPPRMKRTGLKPDVSDLRTFGCVAYVHKVKTTRRKAELRAKRGIFVGYPEGQKGWIVLDPETGAEIVSRDVEFHEDQPGGSLWHRRSEWTEMPSADLDSDDSDDDDQAVPGQPECEDGIDQEASNSDSEEDSCERPRRHTRPPSKLYDPDAIFDAGRGGGLRLKAMKIKAMDLQIPSTHQEAMQSPQATQWRQAELDEIDGLQQKRTFQVTPIPQDIKPGQLVGSRFVYALKEDSDGFVTRFKARLVAKGYSQKKGRDYFDTYAPVGNTVGHRVFLAIAAWRKVAPRNADCTQAFVNADTDVPIYLKPPAGMDGIGNEECLALIKSLYGLKQSSRNWYLLVHRWLTEHKWDMFFNDECLWRKDGELLFFHVDDFHYLPVCEQSYQAWFQDFSSDFPAKDLGVSTQILGMNLHYLDDGSIKLDQHRYIKEILHELRMENAKPDAIPARLHGKEEKEVSPSLEEGVPFRMGLGKLHHAVRQTRPDIAYAVSAVSSGQQHPTKRHWVALKKVYRYLAGTPDRGLLFHGGCEPVIGAWCDADFGSDAVDSKSRTGYIITIGGTPVDWYSKKQDIVALSTAEAEYVAMSKVGQAVIFVRDLVEFMTGVPVAGPTEVRADNQAALAIVEKPSTVHGRSKHIRVRYHFIRDLVNRGTVKYTWTSSETNLADVLTKPLGRIAFERCIGQLMVIGGVVGTVTEEE